jgi:hypothetical protein
MGYGLWPDLSVEISRRRWRCVADPHLCLSEPGAAFVHGLAAQAEVWLGPEFLNILDSWSLYDEKPELLLRSDDRHPGAEGVRHALQLWLRLRDDPGLNGARLYWVRDAVRESRLPDGFDESVVPRWEAMAEALDERLSTSAEPSGPMIAAMRDTAALAGLLPRALLITRHEPEEPAAKPVLCRHLEHWRVPCRKLDYRDDLVGRERNLVLQMLIEAGLAGFMWSGMRLVVVHLEVPGRSYLPFAHPDFASSDAEADFLTHVAPRPIRGVWEDARAFWYDLAAEN